MGEPALPWVTLGRPREIQGDPGITPGDPGLTPGDLGDWVTPGWTLVTLGEPGDPELPQGKPWWLNDWLIDLLKIFLTDWLINWETDWLF